MHLTNRLNQKVIFCSYCRGGRPGSNRSGTSSFLRGGGSLRSSRENSFNSQRSAASRERSVSRQNSFERSRNRSIGSARERSLDRLSNRSASRGTRTSLDRRRSTSLERGRSSSIERPRTDRSRDRFRDSSLERSRDGSLVGGNRSRTSSTGSYRSRASSPSCAGKFLLSLNICLSFILLISVNVHILGVLYKCSCFKLIASYKWAQSILCKSKMLFSRCSHFRT